MSQERIAWVDKRNDPETCAAIERNGWGDPVPVEAKEFGYWVTAESLEQYRERPATPVTDPGVTK